MSEWKLLIGLLALAFFAAVASCVLSDHAARIEKLERLARDEEGSK